MSQEKFDLIVLGGGPAGTLAASKASELKAKVALVERGRLGGVSTNDGCVPVRALAHAARLVRESEQFVTYGLIGEKPEVNFPQVLARAQAVVDQVHHKKDLLGELKQAGVEVFTHVGDTKFLDQNTISFPDGRELQADKFIICVGGHGRKLPIPGCEYAITHSDIWSLEKLPKSVSIIGTGATGCQLASVLSAFGSEVFLLERSERILRTEDVLVSEVVGAEFIQRGINIIYNYSGIKAIEKQPDGMLKLIYIYQGNDKELVTEAVIFATGWPGNTDKLNLGVTGVEVNKRGFVEVNDYLQTTAPHIYAAGDITGKMMLVSGATHEARIAAENAILGNKRKYKHDICPSGSFTDPEYASVGLREHEVDPNQEYITAVVYYSDFIRSVIDDRTAGFCKLIADVDSRQIIGAHVVGERAVETVNLVAAAMKSGVRFEQLAELEIAYPTYVGIVGVTARELGVALREYMDTDHGPTYRIPTNKCL